jgi:hypothetical protein
MMLMTETETACIRSWDWRYSVSFDKSLESEIRETIAQHRSPEERKVLEDLLGWSKEFVSLDAVLTAIAGAGPDASSVLDGLDERKLLHIPAILKERFERKIGALLTELPSEHTEYLQHLLHLSLEAAYRPLHRDLFQIIFGDVIDDLLDSSKKDVSLISLPASSRPKVEGQEVEGYVQSFKARIRSNPVVRELLEAAEIPDFRISVQEGSGFAEYWPKELLEGSPSDLLVIFENEDSMVPETLDLTLVHEVAPGHGYYYSRLRKATGPLVDYGALILTEGWATWCEWNVLKGAFSNCARATRLYGLRFFDSPVARLPQDYFEYVTKQGYSRQTASDATLYFFQYPGFGFSYTLGALWFEEYFKDITPRAFFDFLDRRSWGDFFRLWHT